MKGLTLFQGEIIINIKKNALTKFKIILFFRTTEPISNNIGTMHPWVKGIQVSLNEEPINSHEVNNNLFFSLNQL